jgi:autotransporter-associated beta strand protein
MRRALNPLLRTVASGTQPDVPPTPRRASTRPASGHVRNRVRVGIQVALLLVPALPQTTFAQLCDTPSATCEILGDRTYSDPNAYNYTAAGKSGVGVSAVGGNPRVTITQTGGTVIAGFYSLENKGYYNMSGGTANIAGDFIVSIYSSGAVTSEATQSGGTMNVGALRMALYNGNTGTYTLNGGNLNIPAGSVSLVRGGTNSARAYLYLNGGTLTSSEIVRDGNGGGNAAFQSRGELRFNGGTLRAGNFDNANWLFFDNGYSYLNNVTVLAIDGGGAIFDTNGRNMGIAVPLPGSGGVTKRGAGTLSLSAGNPYAGITMIEAGTLSLANTNAIVNSTAVLSGGALAFGGITTANLGGLAGSQPLTLQNTDGAGVTLAVGGNGASTTYSGVASGIGSLVKNGSGTLLLSNRSSWTGGTIVNGGTLRLAAPSPDGLGTIHGTVTINGATLETASVDALGYTGSSVQTVILNGGTLLNSAAGNNGWGVDYRLSNGATMQSNGGVASATAPSNFSFGGPGASNTAVRASGSTPSTIAGHIQLRGDNGHSNVNVTVDDGATLNIPAAISSQTSGVAAPIGFTKLGSGLLALSAANVHTGDTVISAGTLAVDHAQALQASTAVLNGGAVGFRTVQSATFGGLAGTQPLVLQSTGNAAVALSVGANNTSTSFAGALTGTGSLTKAGTGTLTLGGQSNYLGATAITSGALRVNGATGSGALTVAGATTLTGSGSIGGAATVQSGGRIAPGNTLGTLTFANGLSLNGGAVVDFELGTSSDQVRVSGGAFTRSGNVTLNLANGGGFGMGSYTLFDFTGATPTGIDAAGFTLGTVIPGIYVYRLSIQGSKLVLTVSPPRPVVSSVSVPAAGLYGIGKRLEFTVRFDKPTFVTGLPRLPVVLNSGTAYANYVSGSGTTDLLFAATVVGGNHDNDGIALAATLDANGGTLRDDTGADADLTLSNVPSTTGIKVDGIAPTASAIVLQGAPPATSTAVTYTVTFSEAVTGVNAAAFSIATIDGTATGEIGTVAGSGSSYTVVARNIGGVGQLRLVLKSVNTGIVDLADNAILGGHASGDTFQADVQLRCFVHAGATGANDGTRWADAYTDLQTAVRNAGCAEVWAAKGVYKPGSATSDSFRPRFGVKLHGGFAGTETSLDERTPGVIAANPTVLSGDIDGNDGSDASGVVLDAAQIAGSNSVHVIQMNNGSVTGYTTDTEIDGFIITGGDASASFGGGLRCDGLTASWNCSFTLSNVVFSGNRALVGGALGLASNSGSSDPVLSKVLFRGNRAALDGGAVSLSASAAGGRANPLFSNVVFIGNRASNWGGAIGLNVNLGSVTPTFENVTFTDNISTARRGGAIASQAFGGGVSRPTLRNAILWSDAANAGDPEIILDGSGTAVLEDSLVQGGCPNGSTCTNLITGDPKLGALGDHGGAIPSLLPGAGSAAIDAGSCRLADDMRGVARPQGADCDIGAVEVRLVTLGVSVNGGGQVSAGAIPLPMSGSIAACSGDCNAAYSGETPQTVTLTATPDAYQSFSGWSGDCSGSEPATTVAMTAAKTCIATFVPNVTETGLILSGGSNPATYTDVLSFTATVLSQTPVAPPPAGSVDFHADGSLLGTATLDGSGEAHFTTSALAAGAHVITAQYRGDANYAATAQPPSAALMQNVIAATPMLTWSTPAAIAYGTPLGSAQLNATASWNGQPVDGSFTYAPLAGLVLGAGTEQTLSVVFTPLDTNFSTASASVTIDVTRASLSVTGTQVADKPYDGTTTATLTGGTLVGVLPADVGGVTLTQSGVFALAHVGLDIAVTANDSISGSTAAHYTLTQPTGLSGRITPLTLTYHALPVTIPYGTMSSGLSGSVIGFISGESQATATTGEPSFTTTATASSAAGHYAISGGGLSANHGNYVFAQDPGNETALTITAAATTTTIANAQPWNVPLGTPTTVTVAVAAASGSGVPTGSVTVSDGGTGSGEQCTIASLTNGSGSCTLIPGTAGAKTVTATYTPDVASGTNFTTSVATAPLSVDPTQPLSTLQSSANPGMFGQTITLTATVTAVAGGVTPSGAVHFFTDDTTEICANALLIANGTSASASAECVVPQASLNAGEHVLRFDYEGDGNNTPSSATLNQVVDKAGQTLTFPVQSPASRGFVANGTFVIAPLATSAAPNSGHVIVYSSLTSGICAVSETTVTMLAAGTCMLAANQAGDGNYNAAAQVTQNVALLLAPSAAPQSVMVSFNAARSITLSGSDANPGGPYALSYAIATQPVHGAISTFDTLTGTLTYTPTSDYSGADSFTFTVSSVNGTSQPAMVSITVSQPSIQLAFSILDWHDYARYGQIVDASVRLSNTGDAVQNHTVTFALSPGFDAAQAVLSCADAGNGTTCAQNPSNPLQFQVSLPAGRTLSWNVAVPVLIATTEPSVTLAMTADGAVPVSATATLVLFRDGFDDMQDSVAALIDGASAKAILDGDALRELAMPMAVEDTTSLLIVRDDSREVRVESRADGEVIRVRLRARDAEGQQRTSVWSTTEAGATLVLGSVDTPATAETPSRAIVLVGATTPLVMFPGSGTALPR